MKAKAFATLFTVLWGVLFALGVWGSDGVLPPGEECHFRFTLTLMDLRSPLVHWLVPQSLKHRRLLADHLALLFLERFDPPREEKERILDLLEYFFPESPVCFHAALFSAQREGSFAFALLALRHARGEEEKLAALEVLFSLLKERGYVEEAALLLARIYQDFRGQGTVKTREMFTPLLPSLTPSSFSPEARMLLAECFLALGFLEKAEAFAQTLEDAFTLKARLFLRTGNLKALEKLLEGRRESDDVLFYRAVLAERRGEYENAANFYETLLSRFPESPRALSAFLNLASVYRAQKAMTKSIEVLEKGSTRFPTNGTLLWELFFTLYQEQAFTKAQEVLARLAQLPDWRNQALFWQFKLSKDASFLATILKERRLDYYYVRATEILGPSSPFTTASPPSLSLPEPLSRSFARYRFLSSLRLFKNAEIEITALLSQNQENAALLLEAVRFFAQQGAFRKSISLAFRLFPKDGGVPEAVAKGYYPLAFFRVVERLAGESHPPLDPYLVLALIHAESAFDPQAVSPAGAIGLAQVMPATGSWVVEKGWVRVHENPGEIADLLRNPEANLAIGIAYFAYLLRRFDGDLVLALCGYNAGPGRAERWRQELPLDRDVFIESIPFQETRNYVKKVLTNYFAYTLLYRGLTANQGTP